jgi:hypothetical protein
MKNLCIAAAAVVLSLSMTPAFAASKMACDAAGINAMTLELTKVNDHTGNVVTAYEEMALAVKALVAKDMAACEKHMEAAHTAMSK